MSEHAPIGPTPGFPIDLDYVNEILMAAEEAKVVTREEWHRLTLRDCAGGYHNEVAEAERQYFKGRS